MCGSRNRTNLTPSKDWTEYSKHLNNISKISIENDKYPVDCRLNLESINDHISSTRFRKTSERCQRSRDEYPVSQIYFMDILSRLFGLKSHFIHFKMEFFSIYCLRSKYMDIEINGLHLRITLKKQYSLKQILENFFKWF